MAAITRPRAFVPAWPSKDRKVARMLIRRDPLRVKIELVRANPEGFICQATRLHKLDHGKYDTLLRCDLAGHHEGRHSDHRWSCSWGRGPRRHTHVIEL